MLKINDKKRGGAGGSPFPYVGYTTPVRDRLQLLHGTDFYNDTRWLLRFWADTLSSRRALAAEDMLSPAFRKALGAHFVCAPPARFDGIWKGKIPENSVLVIGLNHAMHEHDLRDYARDQLNVPYDLPKLSKRMPDQEKSWRIGAALLNFYSDAAAKHGGSDWLVNFVESLCFTFEPITEDDLQWIPWSIMRKHKKKSDYFGPIHEVVTSYLKPAADTDKIAYYGLEFIPFPSPQISGVAMQPTVALAAQIYRDVVKKLGFRFVICQGAMGCWRQLLLKQLNDDDKSAEKDMFSLGNDSYSLRGSVTLAGSSNGTPGKTSSIAEFYVSESAPPRVFWLRHGRYRNNNLMNEAALVAKLREESPLREILATASKDL